MMMISLLKSELLLSATRFSPFLYHSWFSRNFLKISHSSIFAIHVAWIFSAEKDSNFLQAAVGVYAICNKQQMMGAFLTIILESTGKKGICLFSFPAELFRNIFNFIIVREGKLQKSEYYFIT